MPTIEELGKMTSQFNPGGFEKITAPTPMPTATPEGSVLGATIRQNNLTYNFFNTLGSSLPEGTPTPGFDPIDFIPDQFLEFAPQYATAKNLEQLNYITEQIQKELHDRAILAGHPIQTFLSNIVSNSIDLPNYLLPGGTLYASANAQMQIGKSALSMGLASAGQTLFSEQFLYNTQRTRRLEDTAYNTIISGLIGSARGYGIAAYLNSKMGMAAMSEGVDVAANGRPTRNVVTINDDGTITVRPSLPESTTKFLPESKGMKVPKPPKGGQGGTPPAPPSAPTSGMGGGVIPQQATWLGPNNTTVTTLSDFKNLNLFDSSLAKFTETTLKPVTITPYMRGKTSPFGTVRAATDELFESLLGTIATDNQFSPKARNMEVRIKRSIANHMYHLLDIQDVFFEQRGLGSSTVERATSYIKTILTSSTLPGLTWEDFMSQLSTAIRTNQVSGNPAILKAKDIAQKKILDPLRDRAIELGLLPPNVSQETANSYLMRIWNKDAIVELRDGEGGFEEILFKYFMAVNEALKVTLPKVARFEKALKFAQDALTKETDATKLKDIQNIIDKINESIEGLKYQNIMGQTSGHLLHEDGSWRKIQSLEELRADVTQTINNIIDLGDERLSNPIISGIRDSKTKPLKNRVLLIPDEVVERFLINDAMTVLQRYIRSMGPITEMTAWAKERGFGDVTEAQGSLLQMVRDEALAQSAGKSQAEKSALNKRLASDIKDLNAIFDMLLGVYGPNPSDEGTWSKIARGFMDYNQIRLMGSMALSALPDIGTVAMRYGAYSLIHEGILPLLKSEALRKMTKNDLQVIGFCCNTQLGMRQKSYADTGDLTIATGKFGRIRDAVQRTYGNVVWFNQWSDIAQELAGGLSINFYMKYINIYKESGRLPAKVLKRMARAGIGVEDFDYLHEQWLKHGGVKDGAYYANMGAWDIGDNPNDSDKVRAKKAETFQRFQEAIIMEVHNTVVEPTLADKPLFMHTLPGKVATQFKSFGYAATFKIFLSGLQNLDDQNTLQGIIILLALGALGYVATSLARGDEPDLSFANLSKEAIDRSGMLGIFSELINMSAKSGFIPGLGTTRYQTRGILGTWAGPTVGALEDVGKLLSRIMQANNGKPLTTKDVDAFLRLMPYQNVFYARQIASKALKTVAVQLGAREVPEKRRRQ